MSRYKVPRGPYQRHASTPKEAALRHIIGERYRRIETETTIEEVPSIFGFPAFIDDIKSVKFLPDGSLSIHMMIPAAYLDDFHKYAAYIVGQPMAVTMEPIRVTLEDLTARDA